MPATKLPAAVEHAVTRHFYRGDKTAGGAVGLQAPLFWWTHRSLTHPQAADRDAAHAAFLARWFAHCGLGAADVCFAAPTPDAAAVLRRCLGGLPFAALDLSTDSAPVTTRVTVLLLGGAPSASTMDALASCADAAVAALDAASNAALLVGTADWAMDPAAQPDLGVVARKLQQEAFLVSGTDTPAAPAGLMGAVLPLCCPDHPTERRFVTSNDIGTNPGFCRRLCGKPFACGHTAHVCAEPCHPGAAHGACPYPCGERLRCGHRCRMLCGEPCDCLETATVDKTCSHDIAVGFDAATERPILVSAPHRFSGACADRHGPCRVSVPVPCGLCDADITVPCCEHAAAAPPATATEGGEEAVPAPSAAVCEDCLQLETQLRRDVRTELLHRAEDQKKQHRREVAAQTYVQERAAQQGMFQVGQRVVLGDEEHYRGEMPDLFPDVSGRPGGWCTDTPEALLGDHATIVDRQVDLVDTTEMLYLVGLVRGGHIVFADRGLSLVRAHITCSGGVGGPKNAFGANNMLMLTAAADNVATQQRLLLAAPPTEGDEAEEQRSKLLAAAKRAFPVDSHAHLLQPVRLPGCEENTEAEAEAEDDDDPPTVTNVCGVVSGHSDAGDVLLRVVLAVPCGLEEPALKRRRSEGSSEDRAESSSGPAATEPQVLDLAVPPAALEALVAPSTGVVVRGPAQHVNAADERAMFDIAAAGADTFVTTPLLDGEPCVVLGCVNAAEGTEQRRKGPCYVVSPWRDRKHRRAALVPVALVAPDADAAAEKDLQRGLREELETLVAARMAERVEERLLKNVEVRRRKARLAAVLHKKGRAATTYDGPNTRPAVDREKLQARRAAAEAKLVAATQALASTRTSADNAGEALAKYGAHRRREDSFDADHRRACDIQRSAGAAPPVAQRIKPVWA